MVQDGGLVTVGLDDSEIDADILAGVDRDIGSTGGAADGLGQCGTRLGLTRDGRDAKQLAAGLPQEIGETNRVVNVRSDIGIEQNGYNIVVHKVFLS